MKENLLLLCFLTFCCYLQTAKCGVVIQRNTRFDPNLVNNTIRNMETHVENNYNNCIKNVDNEVKNMKTDVENKERDYGRSMNDEFMGRNNSITGAINGKPNGRKCYEPGPNDKAALATLKKDCLDPQTVNSTTLGAAVQRNCTEFRNISKTVKIKYEAGENKGICSLLTELVTSVEADQYYGIFPSWMSKYQSQMGSAFGKMRDTSRDCAELIKKNYNTQVKTWYDKVMKCIQDS